jgi:hypothetical protein
MEENNDFAAMLGLASVEDLRHAAREIRKRNGNGCP